MRELAADKRAERGDNLGEGENRKERDEKWKLDLRWPRG